MLYFFVIALTRFFTYLLLKGTTYLPLDQRPNCPKIAMCRRYEICCCCGSLQTGSKIIIFLDLIGAILSFFAFCVIISTVPDVFSHFWVAGVVKLGWICIDSLGLYGLFSKKPNYLIGWLISHMIILVVSTYYA